MGEEDLLKLFVLILHWTIRNNKVAHHPLSDVLSLVRNYLDDIFDMIKEFWTADSPLQSTIILLVEAIAVALQSEFKAGGGRV